MAVPMEVLLEALRGSLLAVCKVRRARGHIVSTVDVDQLADELALRAAKGVAIVLGVESALPFEHPPSTRNIAKECIAAAYAAEALARRDEAAEAEPDIAIGRTFATSIDPMQLDEWEEVA